MKAKSSAPRVFHTRKHRLSHHGGSWKVAYADFVTAMMAFFLLMWILNMVPKDVQKAIETYFKSETKVGKVMVDPNSALSGDPDEVRAELTEEQAARFAIAMRFKKIITDDPFLKQSSGVSSDDAGVLLRVSNDVMFQPGSAALTPEADKVIREVREVLKSFKLNLMVRGHCLTSEQVDGPYPSVWELAGARSGAVARALLQDKAISPGRVRAVSLGDTVPLVPSFDAGSEALNRRVEFYFHRPDVSYQRVVN